MCDDNVKRRLNVFPISKLSNYINLLDLDDDTDEFLNACEDDNLMGALHWQNNWSCA